MFPPKQGLTLTRSRTTSGRWRRRRRRGRSTPFPRTGSAARTSSWKPLLYGLFLYYAKHLFYPILRWLSFRMKEKYFNDVRAKQADRLYAVLGIRIYLFLTNIPEELTSKLKEPENKTKNICCLKFSTLASFKWIIKSLGSKRMKETNRTYR